MENIGKVALGKEFTEAIVSRLKDAIRNNMQALPCQFSGKDVNGIDFKLDVDAKLHLEIAGVSCDFEIHYPQQQ
jgi:hypothetical protein